MNLKLSKLASDWFLIVLLFLYIYSPDFSFVGFNNSGIVLFPLAIFGYAFFLKPRYIISFLTRNKVIVVFQFLILFLVLLSTILQVFQNSANNVSLASQYPISLVRFYFEVIVASVALHCLFAVRKKEQINDLINAFFWIISIQFAITLLSLISPSLRDYINFSILNPNSKLIQADWLYQRRGYGLASGHLFFYPLFNGFILSIALWGSVSSFKKKINYLVYALMALFPIFLNARVGLISIPSFIVSLLLIKPFNLRYTLGLALTTISTGTLSILLFSFLVQLDIFGSSTLRWIYEGILQYQAFFSGQWQDVTILNALLDGHVHFPTNLLIGDGKYLFQNESISFNSDIGYINYLYFGGLLYSILLYAPFVWIFWKAILKTDNIALRGILLSGLIIIFIANFKGIIFQSNSLTRACFLMIIFILFEKSKNIKIFL